MPLRNPTDEETQSIIHVSLSTLISFEHEPDEPEFLEEVIAWEADVLAIPPVTKTYLHTHTLVATINVIPGSTPSLSRNLFFAHLDETADETVEQYRDFLRDLLLVEED